MKYKKDRQSLQDTLLRWLPMENLNFNSRASRFINNPIITLADVKEFETVMQPILDTLELLKLWVMDLAIELQNHLLGGYADCKVFHRKPTDPKFLIVSIDKYNFLMKYFDEEIEQGQKVKLAEESAWQEQLRKKIN